MSYDTMSYEMEREHDLAVEAMSRGEYMRAAVAEYAREYGREDTTRAWILSPFDTWEPNPFYVGPPVPHPEWEDDR